MKKSKVIIVDENNIEESKLNESQLEETIETSQEEETIETSQEEETIEMSEVVEIESESKKDSKILDSESDFETLKSQIDKMTHLEIATLWYKEGSHSNKLFQGKSFEYIKNRLFIHFGGFNPEIMKNIK